MHCLQPSRTHLPRPPLPSAAARVVRLLVLSLAIGVTACEGDPLGPLPEEPLGVRPALNAAVNTTWPQVSVGGDHSCALAADGDVTCWGRNELGQATPPAGTYSQVSAGYMHTCAVRSDGSIACWGNNDRSQATPPAGTFLQVSAASTHSCAITANRDITCWGWNSDGQVGGAKSFDLLGTIFTHSGPFAMVSAGGYHTCAITEDGLITCWGRVGAVDAPPDEYVQLNAAMYHTCAVRVDGQVDCWPFAPNGQATAPVGPFTQVTTGFSHSCGVRTDGDVVCWGYDGYGQVSGSRGDDYYSTVFTHEGPFSEVGGGNHHTCAARVDGALVCWGAGTNNTGIAPHYGQSAPPFLQAPQTIAFTSVPPSPAPLSGSYTVSAAGGSSGNPVLFSSLTPTVCTAGASVANASTVALIAVGICTVAANQEGNGSHLDAAQVEQTFAVTYQFGASTGGGFAPPVSSTAFNAVRAGQSVPVKFDLGGDQGPDVLAAGSPTSAAIACATAGDPVNSLLEATLTAGASGLSYDAATGLYTYVWKTDRTWAGTCRRFTITLDDETEHSATFQFAR